MRIKVTIARLMPYIQRMMKTILTLRSKKVKAIQRGLVARTTTLTTYLQKIAPKIEGRHNLRLKGPRRRHRLRGSKRTRKKGARCLRLLI